MVEVRWTKPACVGTEFNKTRIFRSVEEQGRYTLAVEIDSVDPNGNPVSRYEDPGGTRQTFYIIRFFDSANQVEYSEYILGYLELTPKEKRLITYIVSWVPDVLRKDLTEADIATSLRLSLYAFNVQPPETYYSLDNFPEQYVQYLILGAQINLALLKYLKLGIRDFSYSDMGLTLNIDRGTKMAKAAEDLGNMYHKTLGLVKMNFMHQGVGLGTVPLPISMGSSLGRGLLNVLDIFNAMGR